MSIAIELREVDGGEWLARIVGLDLHAYGREPEDALAELGTELQLAMDSGLVLDKNGLG